MQRPTESAILDATERLLAQRRFPELAVGDIIEAAGVSRTSFYAHFGSRAAVLAACLRRVVGQVAARTDAAPPPPVDVDRSLDDPAAAIRSSLERWVDLAGEHGPLLRTVSEEWPHDPELRDLWFQMVGAFAASTAGVIERAREAGTAPPGADAQALATVLMWGCERVLHVSLVGGAAGLTQPAAILEPLSQMMIGAALGQTGDR